MRRYADPVEVRQGPLEDDARGLGAQGATEGPQQFLWRGRLWKVRAVLAHWVETGPWWQSTGARAATGADPAGTEEAGADESDHGRVSQRVFLATCSPSASCGGSRPAGPALPPSPPTVTSRQASAASSTCPSTGPTGTGRSSAARTEGVAR